MSRYLYVPVLAALVLASTGCEMLQGRADFPVSVSNRLVNRMMFYANGVEQGEVLPGRARAFSVQLKTVSGGGATSPSPTAQVTFTARDIVTGKLSREKKMYLTQDRPENVEFNASDFQ